MHTAVNNRNSGSGSSSFCKVCAQNGFPKIRIYWKSTEVKEDGSPRWVPYEDADCTIRHRHRLPQAKSEPSIETDTLTTQSQQNAIKRGTLLGDRRRYLANRNVIQILMEVTELCERQNRLLHELAKKINYSWS